MGHFQEKELSEPILFPPTVSHRGVQESLPRTIRRVCEVQERGVFEEVVDSRRVQGFNKRSLLIPLVDKKCPTFIEE